jgi:hypothetical protein
MPNVFPARDRSFIASLSEKLNLPVTWDEYDENDQNLVTWRLPDAVLESVSGSDEQDGENGEGEWIDVDEDEESRVAVDRVLEKYEDAHVVDDDEDGDFDTRSSDLSKTKMDEWKRAYYKVRKLFDVMMMPFYRVFV